MPEGNAGLEVLAEDERRQPLPSRLRLRTDAQTTSRNRAGCLPPLSPVLGGEGSGVRGLRQTTTRCSPLTPDPSPPSTGERGGSVDRRFGKLFVRRS